MKHRGGDMVSGPLFSGIIYYTIPIVLTSVLQLLFNAADLVVVGQFCGSISVAAVGATGSLTNLIINLFIGLSVGAGVTVAHGLGSRQDKTVHNVIHTAIPIALLSGALLTVVGVCFSRQFLILMGTPDNVLPLSALYMKIYFCGITFTVLYNYCAAILRAAGDTRSPLIFLMIAGVINVTLNLIFVIVFHMNVAGVALATAISQAVSAVLVVVALMRRTDACHLDWRKLRFYKPQLKKLMRIGLPAGIQASLFSISNVTIQSSVNSFGDVFMSGNAAAINIEGFIYVAMCAFSQTAVNFIGQNVGAGQYKRVSRVLWICMACGGAVGITLSVLAYGFGPQLLSIYITDSPLAVRYGMLRFAYVILPYVLCGLMDISTGALRGMGESFIPMVISVLGVCALRVGWVYTIFQIPQFHTPQWLFLSYPVSWILTLAAQMIAYAIVYKKQSKRRAISLY